MRFFRGSSSLWSSLGVLFLLQVALAIQLDLDDTGTHPLLESCRGKVIHARRRQCPLNRPLTDGSLQSPDSIKAAAKIAAEGALKYYPGDEPGQVPGLLAQPYYWWLAGALMGLLVEYGHYTGDDGYNDLITEAMLFQVGADDFMPRNQTKSEVRDPRQSPTASARMMRIPGPQDIVRAHSRLGER